MISDHLNCFTDFFRLTSDFLGIYEKTEEARTSPAELLIKDILNRTEFQITLLDVFVRDVEVSFLRYLHAGMSEQTAQCVNVHAVHQTALGEVVAQRMR